VIISSIGEPAAVLVSRQLRAKRDRCAPSLRILENYHSQE
jgi:hypothetical protein